MSGLHQMEIENHYTSKNAPTSDSNTLDVALNMDDTAEERQLDRNPGSDITGESTMGISPAKRRRRQPPPSDGPTRRSTRLTLKKEESHEEEDPQEVSSVQEVVETTTPKRTRKSNKGNMSKPPAKDETPVGETSSPRRLLGTPPFNVSGGSTVTTSATASNVTQEISPAVVETTPASSAIRRSKRQSERGVVAKKAKYPEGEWISSADKRARAKSADGPTPNVGKRRGRKRKELLKLPDEDAPINTHDGPSDPVEPTVAPELDGNVEITSAVHNSEVTKNDSEVTKNASEGSDDEDEDMPLAMIALDRKVAEMLQDQSERSSVCHIPHQETNVAPISEKPNNEQYSADPIFSADSDKEDNDNNDKEPTSSRHKSQNEFNHQLSSSAAEPEAPSNDDNVQYPCTICRQLALVGQLTRCQNCPRYFHPQCVDKDGDGNSGARDPARRRFCPKCVRAGPAVAASLLSSSIAKRRQNKPKTTKPGRLIVKYRQGPSGLIDVGDMAKTCPGCGALRLETNQKREKGEDYSLYCNNDCVLKIAQRTRKAMKGDNNRVLIMDTTTGNVLRRQDSPYLKDLVSWLQGNLHCFPYPLERTKTAKTRLSSQLFGPASSTKESTSAIKETEKRRTSAPAPLEQEPKKPAGVSVPDTPKLKTIISRDQLVQIDPGRLNVRKALRDVLLLRARDADDVLLTNDEIKQLAVDFEQEIHKVHKDENSYKQQCRNLITNLRNPTNNGFFRRLLNGDLSTKRAATLTAAEMASTEYSYWAPAAEQERAEETERLKSAYMETSKLFSRTKVVSEADSTCDIFGLLHNDTTAEHKSHLFDLNCKICTGKQKDDDVPTPLRRERKDSSISKTSTTLICRPELGEKLIKRDDGKLDIVYSVPSQRRSDPLHLESDVTTSAVAEFEIGDDISIISGSSTSNLKVSPPSIIEIKEKRTSIHILPGERPASIRSAGSIESPVPSRLSIEKSSHASSTSTVSRLAPPASNIPSFWHGILDMPQWFRFQTSFKSVSGPAHLLKRDFPSHLEIVGRIPPNVVYDYLSQIKKTGGKDIIVFRLPEPPTDDDRRQWDGLFANMMQKQRFCVVDNHALPMIKDFYIVPLAADEEPNESLLPFHDGPGLEIPRRDIILGLVVRHRERLGADVVPKRASTVDDSPIGIVASPPSDSGVSHHSKTKEIGSSVKSQPPLPEMDYMKIIKFKPNTSSDVVIDDKHGVELKHEPSNVETPTAVASGGSTSAASVQPKLKQLLDEIGQAQNPTELASKILNCLSQSVPVSTASNVRSLAQKADESSSTLETRITSDPRQKVHSTVAVGTTSSTFERGPTVAPSFETKSEKEQEQDDMEKKWLDHMQSMMMNCRSTTESGKEEHQLKTSITLLSSDEKKLNEPGSHFSGWQPMVPQAKPPPMVSPAFTVPPPGPHFMHDSGSNTQLARPLLRLPPDFASRPPPNYSTVPPFLPGFAPPPVPPPVGQYSVPPPPPPILLAPPPPPPLPTQASASKKALEEGEVGSSEGEMGDDDDDRWHSRKSKFGKDSRRDKKTSFRHSRWDQTQPSRSGSWERPMSSSQYGQSQGKRGGGSSEDNSGMYRSSNPVSSKDGNYSAAATSSSGSSGSSGVILKQAYYEPRQFQGRNRKWGSGDQRKRMWK